MILGGIQHTLSISKDKRIQSFEIFEDSNLIWLQAHR
jgi:hypothetical protein